MSKSSVTRAATAVLLFGALACSRYGRPETGVRVAYVDRGPPRDRTEAHGRPSSRDLVWMRGYWRWTGRDYAWVPGHFVRLERGYRSWAPGHWRHSRQGWYWTEGHWQ